MRRVTKDDILVMFLLEDISDVWRSHDMRSAANDMIVCFKRLAEREGFEPSIRDEPYTHFPGVRLQPLGHLSTTLS